MNKKFRTIMSKVMLGVSLGVVTATTAIPTTSAYAEYSQSNLSMQTIYRENNYVIAKVNASQRAINQYVYMSCHGNNFNDSKTYDTSWGDEFPDYYYDNATNTKYYNDGTVVTVSPNENNDFEYLVTFKIPQNVFQDISSVTAVFENESFGGQHLSPYQDTNNGHGYRL